MTRQEERDDEREALIRRADETLARINDPVHAKRPSLLDLVTLIQRQREMLAARKHPEPEWEYGVWNGLGHFRYFAPTLAAARQAIAEEARGFVTKPKRVIKRRTKREAGPWVPVGEGER